MAAVGGILLASRDNSVDPDDRRLATTLLYAVGAAVIGGTSLFGGKGRVVDAVLGGLVIAVIDNGMGLLDQPQAPGLHRHRRWCCCSPPASTRSPAGGPPPSGRRR